ncbi:hypothetical protein GGR52DRAFT_429314 [Hypoxylon sp. FL1284]|nr:hypothetical protein GGR52DRAFT_429314 [Hypoxylon sp. FL1284]
MVASFLFCYKPILSMFSGLTPGAYGYQSDGERLRYIAAYLVLECLPRAYLDVCIPTTEVLNQRSLYQTVSLSLALITQYLRKDQLTVNDYHPPSSELLLSWS